MDYGWRRMGDWKRYIIQGLLQDCRRPYNHRNQSIGYTFMKKRRQGLRTAANFSYISRSTKATHTNNGILTSIPAESSPAMQTPRRRILQLKIYISYSTEANDVAALSPIIITSARLSLSVYLLPVRSPDNLQLNGGWSKSGNFASRGQTSHDLCYGWKNVAQNKVM